MTTHKTKPVRSMHKVVHDLEAAFRASPLTRVAAAKKAGVDPKMLSQWKNGSRSPNVSTLSPLAQSLGYEVRLVPIGSREDAA